jgi:hypothetical protein
MKRDGIQLTLRPMAFIHIASRAANDKHCRKICPPLLFSFRVMSLLYCLTILSHIQLSHFWFFVRSLNEFGIVLTGYTVLGHAFA